jgi:hypothetical protein
MSVEREEVERGREREPPQAAARAGRRVPGRPPHLASSPPSPRQANVASESALMVPDTRARLEGAAADLRKALVRAAAQTVGGGGGARRLPLPTRPPPQLLQADAGPGAEGAPEHAAALAAAAAADAALAAA